MEKLTYDRISDEEFAQCTQAKIEMEAAAELLWSTHISPAPTHHSLTTFLSSALRPRRSILLNLVIGEVIFTTTFAIYLNRFFHGSHMATLVGFFKTWLILVIVAKLCRSVLAWFITHREHPKFPGHTEADIAAEKVRQEAAYTYTGPFKTVHKIFRVIGYTTELVFAVSILSVLVGTLSRVIKTLGGEPAEWTGDAPGVLVFLMEDAKPGWGVFAGLTAAYGLVVLWQDLRWWRRMSRISGVRIAEMNAAAKEGGLERDVVKGEVGRVREFQL